MTTPDFVTAGYVLDGPARSQRLAVPSGPGTFRAVRRPLRRGNTYEALVYVPRPRPGELAAVTDGFPPFADPYLSVSLPPSVGGPAVGEQRQGPVGTAEVRFPAWGRPGPATVISSDPAPVDGEALVRRSAYRRTLALAQRLRSRARTPYGFVRAVQSHLAGRRFVYSESPTPSRVPLEEFLFGDRRGYCQQFSGAMALLLRMGGIPARVAAGFSPGSRSDARAEFVVRDTDAHSWVEAWFPGVGWVTFDPTPGDAPAAAQTTDASGDAAAGEGEGAAPGSERGLGRPGVGGFESGEVEAPGTPTAAWVALGALGLAGAGATGLLWRRRLRSLRAPGAAVAELERALARTGRRPTGGTTLTELAARFRGTEGEPYLRALLAQRYGDAGPGPTGAQRAGLRRALAAGLGLRGRARAWWALPPGAPNEPGPATPGARPG
jgi:transglutaminase-like putative cysteine protease